MSAAPQVLIVDDDHRVVELLEIALASQGFRVITAPDGEEAVRRARSERPDLVVLDLRLPRRSGLDVCELLRRDPDDPDVAILVVSALPEPETRLEAFRRGADDYLGKPFSPRELIARARRLLARAAELRATRVRSRELERALAVARDETARAVTEARSARRLRELAETLGCELSRDPDPDTLAEAMLRRACLRSGATFATLLLRAPDERADTLEPWAIHGDPQRGWDLALSGEGALARVVAGLGRPVARHELERFPELRTELAPFVAAGVALMVALSGERGLEGLLALDERRDGRAYDPEQRAALGTLATVASGSLTAAWRMRATSDALLVALANPGAPAVNETRGVATRAARALGLPAGARHLIVGALPFAVDAAARTRLAEVCTPDVGTLPARVLALVDEARAPQHPAARLLAAAAAVARARETGVPLEIAAREVAAVAPRDPAAEALAVAAVELALR